MRLGIDFGGTNLKVGIFTDDGKEISFKEILIDEIRKTQDLLQDYCTDIAACFCSSFHL